MKCCLVIAAALGGLIWAGGCGYVGQVGTAVEMIEEMTPEVEQRNKELQELANPAAAPASEPEPMP